MLRNRWVAVCVVGLLLVSGCMGGGEAPAPEAASEADGGGGADGQSDGGAMPDGDWGSDGEAGGDGAAASEDGGVEAGDDGVGDVQPVEDFEDIETEVQMDDYVDRSPFPIYRPGEYFKYEGTRGMAQELEPFEMTIQSDRGGEWLEADVDVTIESAEGTTTVSGNDSAAMFRPELSLLGNGRTWIWLYRYNLVTTVEPRISELSVGDTWEYESPEQEDQERSGFTFEVTERGSYAGIDCVTVITESYLGDERTEVMESCVSPDVGLPLFFVQYDQDGTVMLEAELVDYSEG